MTNRSANLAKVFDTVGSRCTLQAGKHAVEIYVLRYVDDLHFQLDCETSLTGPERQRAQGLRASDAQADFIQRRACLRWLRETAFGDLPSATAKATVLELPGNEYTISVSSSGRYAIFAASCSARRIGLDVEIPDETHNTSELAQELFSTFEAKALKAASPERANAMFYRIWRLKEAALKFHGCGLAKGLNGTCFIPNSEGQITVYQKDRHRLYGSTASAFFEGRFNNLDLALALPAMPGDEGLWQVAKATQRVQSQKLKTKTSQIRFGT